MARLGELDLRGWWRAHGLDATGRYVLSNIFPRTWRAAALELDLAAATRIHEEVLGRSSAVHLFSERLPYARWARGWLAEHKTAAGDATLFTDLERWDDASAVAALSDWCGGVEGRKGEELPNGLLLGRLRSDDLGDPVAALRLTSELCAAYVEQVDDLRIPYFDLAP